MLQTCAECVPIRVHQQMYFAFAQVFLMFGIECWGNTAKENLNKIILCSRSVDKIGLHVPYFLYHWTHCAVHAANATVIFCS